MHMIFQSHGCDKVTRRKREDSLRPVIMYYYLLYTLLDLFLNSFGEGFLACAHV